MSKIKVNFKMPPESVAQKLYRRQQELRKKSGLPDPEEYKKRMQQYDKELGMKKESVYVDELPDTGGDSRNTKSVVSDVDPQKKRKMDLALAIANKVNEAAWGRDKMANLQAAHDRHSEKAIAANRSGDHDAVKVHQSKMGMIKTQMNKLRMRKEETSKDPREYDYEGDMAKSQLRSIIANAQQAHDMLDDNTNMAEWVQSKITLAADYISTVADYMQSEVKEEVELDEVSQETAGSYKSKAAEYIKKYKYSNNPPSVTQKLNKRIAGSKRADTRLNTEDVALDEAKHRVSVTVSEPDHPMVTKRKEHQQKFVRVSGDKEGAVARAQQHYKKQGYKVHGAEYVGGVNEDIEQVDELRTSTLMRYNTKAHASAHKLTGQASQAIDNDDRETASKLLNKRDNREVGIDRSRAKIQKNVANKLKKEEVELAEAEFEVGHSHHKTTRMTYSRLEAKNAKDAIAKSQKPGHDLVHVYNMDKETFHHPETGRKKSNQYEHVEEAWNMGGRNPQRGVKVGDKVRSYDFPGMHDDHYIEGHVVADNPHTYHIRVNKVVRSGKEIPVPAHMQHVEAPKGRGMFNNAYAVHKMMAKQQSVTAAPEPTTGAQKTFSAMRGKK